MKNGNTSGVDGISAELMKFLMKDERIRMYTLKCFNNAMKEKINEDWLVSKTTVIPKTKRPKILEHRPIAVTVNSSKIICSIMRERIEEYLIEKKLIYENQTDLVAEVDQNTVSLYWTTLLIEHNIHRE